MDDIIDRIGSRISAWLWFARSTSLGSDALVTDLLGEVGTVPRRTQDASLDDPR